jgi:hypothetical protein
MNLSGIYVPPTPCSRVDDTFDYRCFAMGATRGWGKLGKLIGSSLLKLESLLAEPCGQV